MKFSRKLTLGIICLLSLLFGIGSSLLLLFSFKSVMEREILRAETAYHGVLRTLSLTEELGLMQQPYALSDILSQLTPADHPAWSGIYLASPSEEILKEGEIQASVSPAKSQLVRNYFLDASHRNYLQLTGSFSIDGTPYTLSLSYDITSIYEAREQQLSLYLAVFAGMLVLGGILSTFLSYSLTKPLMRLSLAAKAIAGGDLQYRVLLKPTDEIGTVGCEFDRMAGTLQRTIEELQDARERQDRFISSFTHELKTPMTAMIGYADLLQQEALTKEEQQMAAAYIFSEARRLERLSIRLLALQVGKQQSPQLTPVNLDDFLKNIAAALSPSLAEAGITLVCQSDSGSCFLDEDLVKSLLLNLIDNGKKAISGQGTIFLTASLTTDGCILSVKDTGCGIPEEAIPHLTEPFYRVDKARSRAKGGAGLGLSLCHQITSLHGGTLHFESVVGIGTTVTATLKGGRL